VWAWREQRTSASGPAPAPRELHAAWVRPAVVRLVAGGGAAGAARVRVIHPPALVVYGGRGATDGARAAMADVAVLPLGGRALDGRALRAPAGGAGGGDDAAGGEGEGEGEGGAPAWTLVPRPRGAPGGHAAAAAAPTPSGLSLLLFGGLTADGDLSGDLWALDATNGVAAPAAGAGAGAGAGGEGGGAAPAADPPPLDPARWPWRTLPLAPAEGVPRGGGGGDADDAPLPARFAAAAATLPACARGCCGARLLIFGGMTPLEDLAGGALVDVPADVA